MIKIVFFIETLRAGGAEKVLLNLVSSMDHSRFAVTVVTPWPEDRSLLPPQVQYQSLYRAKNSLTRILYRLDAATGAAYRKIRGSFDIEVAYLECGPTKVMSASRSSAKKLAWVHCDLRQRSDLEHFLRRSRSWYSRYDRVICVSGSVLDSFRQLLGDTPPATVLYNINDEAQILELARAFAPEADSRPTLTAVGRLSAEKGFDQLIRVCARLKEDKIPFRLQILGEGPERPALEAMIREEDLGSCVSLLGWQSNPYPYMKAADLVVCSSRYEGLSTVVTEALILGKPIVTTPCAGMTELLGDSEYGLITAPGADGLYEGLKQLLTDPGLRAHYAARSALRGRDFRRETLVRQTETHFQSLLEGTHSE